MAMEQGYVAGADAVFKAGVQVVAAPIKSAFWLTGAGYTIPATFTQMSRNFARKGMMEFKAVLDRTFPAVRNLRGLTAKDTQDAFEACVRAALDDPMNPTLRVKAGTSFLEYGYLDDVAAAKFLKGVAPVDMAFDTARLARLNNQVLDAFSGQGPRMTAGKMLGDLGVEATEQSVTTLATNIGKFKDSVARKAIDSVKGDTADDVLKKIFYRQEQLVQELL
ncbi:unnamed protein product [marine sediment metagenome]|uniref:Uncharacterized protein n=1 Tax=marine sediment metagenome TaxID=412755 RepID=X1E0G0_9ZZZZ